jgi:hypothetical protein
MTINDKKPLTIKEWHQSKHKFDTWKEFMKGTLMAPFMVEYWFYWVAYFMEQKLVDVVKSLEKVQTVDDRYLDQVQEMMRYIQNIMYKCRYVLVRNTQHLFSQDIFPCPCQLYQDRFRCFHVNMQAFKIGTMSICTNAKNVLMQDADELIRGFLEQGLSDCYYVWKLYMNNRIHFPVWVDNLNIQHLPLHVISLWEVVCEEQDIQILCHPLLPHPRDFLEKRLVIKDSNLYVDKAQFEYEIPGTLSYYPVVLSSKPSIIPKITSKTIYKEERVECLWKQPTHQVYYQETSTAHKTGYKHKKRRLSTILKEGRKKNKTQYIHSRRVMKTFPVEDGDEYYSVYDDKSDHQSSSSSFYYEWW